MFLADGECAFLPTQSIRTYEDFDELEKRELQLV
jgi:hypothetical protein